jgi:hypothetical protein
VRSARLKLAWERERRSPTSAETAAQGKTHANKLLPKTELVFVNI